MLQAAFPACFRNVFTLSLDSINITNYILLVLLSLMFMKFLLSATVVLNDPGISAHFWFSFSRLCVVKKWVQTYYHSILFLHFTSVCHYFLGNAQNSPSSEVNCWSSWFNCFSLLLLWSLQFSLPRIFFYVPLFHCTWSFLVIHSWLILYLNVLDWAMHWKSRGIWYYVVILSEVSFEKLKYPNLLKYSLPCWGWNDRFFTITYIFRFSHYLSI